MTTTTEAPPAPDTTEIDTLGAQDFALIPPESIRPAKENRQFVDDEDFRALVESVREYGVLVPLLVRRATGGADDYELIAGERRWTAAMELRLDVVPAFVLDYAEDADRLTVMWVENYHHRGLSTMDKARHVGALVDLGMSQREVAEKLGISQPQVSKLAALLKLPPAAHAWVDAGELSQDEAVKIAGLPAPEVKKLIPASAKKPPEPWRIAEAYDNVKTQAAMVQGREKAKELGLKVYKSDGRHVGDRSYQNSACRFPRSSTDTYATLAHVDRKAHEKEACHAVLIEARGDKPLLVPVCANPDGHPRPKGWKPKGADGKPVVARNTRTDWSEKRKRRDAAVKLHLPFVEQLAESALAVALKREEEDYCLEFAAYALLEMRQPVEIGARLLNLEDESSYSTDRLLKDLLAPTAGTVDGFAVLYAMALAGGIVAIEGEINAIAETEGKKRDTWNERDIDPTKAFLRHLDGLIEGVPKYEQLVEAVKKGEALGSPGEDEEDTEADAGESAPPELGTPLPHARCSVCAGNYAVRRNGTMREHRGLDGEVCGGSGRTPALTLHERGAGSTHTVTFKSKRGKIHRTCTCGNRGASSTRENALQVAKEHIDRAHGGVGVVQDELVGA